MTDAIAQIISSRPWHHVIEVAPGVYTPGRYDPKPLLDTMVIFYRDCTSSTKRFVSLAAPNQVLKKAHIGKAHLEPERRRSRSQQTCLE